MNLLGYIFAILVLVSIAFQSYYTNCLYDRKLRQSYNGYQQACKKLQKIYIQHNFDEIPEKRPPSTPSGGKKEKTEDKIFLKKESTPICMRLNLWPVLKEKDTSHFIYRSFRKLIYRLYSPHIIEPKKIDSFVSEYLDLLSKAFESSSKIRLEQIQFTTPSFQRVYYQMLSENPSLLNYIKISETQKICLACSDEILLESLFNQEIAKRCTKNRLDPMHKLSLSKDLLQDWMRIYGIDSSILSYLRCKHSRKDNSERTLTVRDQSTDIVLKQKVSSSTKPSRIHVRESKL